MNTLIDKADLIHGAYYKGECRNAEEARWNAENQLFYYWRTKWGTRYLTTIHHPEDDEIYDVFVVERLCDATEEIPFDGLPY